MLDAFFHYLKPIILYCIRRPLRVLLAGLFFAAAGFYLALNISIDTDFAELIPDDYESVKAIKRVQQQVGTTNEVAVLLQSSSFETNKRFAEAIIPEVMAMVRPSDRQPYFNRYEYRNDTRFLKSNALYFATDDELSLIEKFLEEEIKYARLTANPFYFDLGDDSAVSDSLGLELEARYDELIGSEYPISPDSLSMAVRFYPAGPQTDFEYIRDLYADLDRLLAEQVAACGTSDITYLLGGRLLRNLMEIDAIYADVKNSFAAGTSLLILLVLSYFLYKNYMTRSGGRFSSKIVLSELIRLPATAVIIVLPLAVSLCWTFGVTWLIFKTLNVMTATLGLLLFGMGIDFGIHFYARYTEERRKARSVEASVLKTFMTTGQAITAVGFTTAVGFFILMIADFKGFSEFGAIAGIGILFAIIAMIFLLPSTILVLEKTGLLKTSAQSLRLVSNKNNSDNYNSGYSNSHSGPKLSLAAAILAACTIVTAVAVFLSGGVKFEYDFSNLEPSYDDYTAIAREVRKVYSDRKTRNAAYIITNTPADAVRTRNVIKQRMLTDSLTPTIASVEIIQDRLPFTSSQQTRKLERIRGIRTLLSDPFLSASDSENLTLLQDAASTTAPIHQDSIPAFLIEPFTAVDGTVGNLVIIYPSVGLSDGRNSMNFADDLSDIRIDDQTTYFAGSTSIVASDMLRLMIDEAPVMIALTLSFIIVMKLLIFKSLRRTVLVLIPLAASFLWMFAVMDLAGWKLNFYNIVVLPTILGIGDDSGIHILHRYLEEGKGSIRHVLTSTGEHVTVSSLTTMVGFAGLLFSSHPGLRSIGELAVTGIALMLLASLVLLPAMLFVLEPWIWKDRRIAGFSEIQNSKVRL